jgi:tRNA-modifying protein YgfZ
MAEPASAQASQAYPLPRDTLLVRGPDRKTWLDGLVTSSVPQVEPGKAGYGLLLTKQGKIVTDVFLADDGETLWLGVAAGLGGAVAELLDRYLVMEDAELSRPDEPLQWRLELGAPVDTSVAHGQLKLAGLEARLALAREASAGRPAADLMAEHGLGVFGVDFDDRDNPHEASLDRIAVSWTKGCYLGQEVVCMQDMRGKVKRRLVALDAGPALLAADTPTQDVLLADGSVAGQVSSVHATPAGTRILARISAAVLESSPAFTVRGEPVRLAFGDGAK